jgi:Arc/MetJ-type ribon-helix-helix transcriptional regulator
MLWDMRVHVYIDDELVHEIDDRVGNRGRSSYIEEAVRARLDRERRWELIESSFGTIPDTGHDWDRDPAAWVHDQRHGDPRRVG